MLSLSSFIDLFFFSFLGAHLMEFKENEIAVVNTQYKTEVCTFVGYEGDFARCEDYKGQSFTLHKQYLRKPTTDEKAAWEQYKKS